MGAFERLSTVTTAVSVRGTRRGALVLVLSEVYLAPFNVDGPNGQAEKLLPSHPSLNRQSQVGSR